MLFKTVLRGSMVQIGHRSWPVRTQELSLPCLLMTIWLTYSLRRFVSGKKRFLAQVPRPVPMGTR